MLLAHGSLTPLLVIGDTVEHNVINIVLVLRVLFRIVRFENFAVVFVASGQLRIVLR